eukprot:20375_5
MRCSRERCNDSRKGQLRRACSTPALPEILRGGTEGGKTGGHAAQTVGKTSCSEYQTRTSTPPPDLHYVAHELGDTCSLV